MNEQLQQYARQNLKDGLAQLPEEWQRRFKLMYARDNGRRSVEDAEAMLINEVVDAMPADKLDWAMERVQNSIDKIAKAGAA
jgi:hypothetical protein